jgi:tRNA/tmRNA/rRNA uracil-C5-methylase (TrmA/RlmC/RlmD family)
VAHGGHCVARYEGRVVFVRHALPGETVLARLTEAGEQAKYWRADAVEVLLAAPDRVEPPCPLAGPGRCGGCDWQHASRAAQRELKADVITEQLGRLARLEPGQNGVPEVLVEAVSEPGLGWRTRVRFAVDASGRAGFRRHRSHDVIEVEQCLIAHPQLTELELGQQQWRGVGAVEAIVPSGPSQRLVVVEPVDDQAGAGARLRLPRLPVPASVATRDVEGLHQVRGRTWVSEQVLIEGRPRQFRVTGTGFWQVHPAAAQTLLDAVLAAAQAEPGERALDLYSGVGLFAAGLAAQVGPTGSVIAVESDPRATADARRSLHDLDWVRFETGSVDEVLAGQGNLAGQGHLEEWAADVVVLDPPRSGAGRAVINRITALRPRVIVYVACDPAALARDLATAAAEGYRLAQLRAFDLFPMTHHVECVATLVPSVER